MTVSTISMALPLIYLVLQAYAAWRLPRGWTVWIFAPLCAVAGAAVVFVIAAALGAPAALLPLLINLPLATLYLALLITSWGLRGGARKAV